MNNDTPKEGVVIDATPEPEESHPQPDQDSTAGAPEQAQTAGRNGRGLAGFALLLALVAIALTLAGGWFGYRQWQTLDQALASARDQGGSAADQARSLSQRVGDLDQARQQQAEQLAGLKGDLTQVSGTLAQVQRQFGEQQQLLTRERSLLDEREAQLRTLVNGLNERVGRSGNQWLVAEADYLVRLADHRLRLAGDPATARAALAQADQRLRATADPGWAGVREQLARDITALDTLADPDITGHWSRLGALIDQVPQLTLNDAQRRVARGQAPGLDLPDAEQERTWRTLLRDLWSGIKNAVRIRRTDEPVAAMLPPEHSYFLYENLRLTLQQARLALLQGREQVYRDALSQARDWLTRHFAVDAVSGGLAAALAELAQAPVAVTLPDLSDSLRALQARRALIDAQPAPAPVAPAAGEAPPA